MCSFIHSPRYLWREPCLWARNNQERECTKVHSTFKICQAGFLAFANTITKEGRKERKREREREREIKGEGASTQVPSSRDFHAGPHGDQLLSTAVAPLLFPSAQVPPHLFGKPPLPQPSGTAYSSQLALCQESTQPSDTTTPFHVLSHLVQS